MVFAAFYGVLALNFPDKLAIFLEISPKIVGLGFFYLPYMGKSGNFSYFCILFLGGRNMRFCRLKRHEK